MDWFMQSEALWTLWATAEDANALSFLVVGVAFPTTVTSSKSKIKCVVHMKFLPSYKILWECKLLF